MEQDPARDAERGQQTRAAAVGHAPGDHVEHVGAGGKD